MRLQLLTVPAGRWVAPKSRRPSFPGMAIKYELIEPGDVLYEVGPKPRGMSQPPVTQVTVVSLEPSKAKVRVHGQESTWSRDRVAKLRRSKPAVSRCSPLEERSIEITKPR